MPPQSGFSVLQSVYKKDNPAFFSESLQSIADNTLLPEEVVLVKDGELTPQLEDVIHQWQDKLPLRVVGYERNQGLGFALNYGLQFVKTDLVARMDSDDICFPDRFEKQVTFMRDNPRIGLSSGFIAEFGDDSETINTIRKVPLSNSEIKTRLKIRNPFNHMAVIFKKQIILNVGSYQTVPLYEDYDLWFRVLNNGVQGANIPELLVKVRVGNGMIGRRHGFSYAKKEIVFWNRQMKSGFVTKGEYIKLLFLRVPSRLLPQFALTLVYKALRKSDS